MDLAIVLRKNGHVIVRPSRFVTVLPDGDMTKVTEIRLRGSNE